MIMSLPDALDRTAARFPEREAVRCHDRSLPYAALQQRANHLAGMLRAQGVQRGDRVGLYLHKDIASVVAVYGIMKAAAAYVPLDPFAPIERLRAVLEDCAIRGLITAPDKRAQVCQMAAETPLHGVVGLAPSDDLAVSCVPWSGMEAVVAASAPDIHLRASDLAYILYTSGSTGVPKGIMHTHGSAMSFARWAVREYGLQPTDRVSNHAPLHFDLSTFDLYATLLAGGTTVLIPERLSTFPARLSQLLQEERISVWYSVPFALLQRLQRGMLAERDLRALRWVLFAGEPFPSKHLRCLMTLLPQARYSNLYGPTETNVCTYSHVERLPEVDAPLPIGRPCANTEVLVLDNADREVPDGEVGELVVRGSTVMRGYWGRADLNARCFYQRHAVAAGPERFYRTGDLVQLRPDGNLVYLGRKDRQIKTRGYRVELDEIEVTLLAHAQIQEAAVYTVSDGQGSTLIAAAITPTPGRTPTQHQLARHLATRLPSYAIPTTLIVMQALPHSATGKIDRHALQKRTTINGASGHVHAGR